jgi:transcriptional regulator with GAF, ATPase, and Fis domain
MEQNKYPKLDGYDWHELIRNHIDVPNVDVKGIALRLKALLEAKSEKPSEHILDALLQSQRWLEESGHKTELIRTQIEIRRYHLSADDAANADQMEARINEALAGIDPDLIPGDISVFNKVQRNEKSILSEILKLSQEISIIRDGKGLVQRIISAANRITGAERGAIFLRDPSIKADRLTLRASRTLTEQDVNESEFDGPMALIKRTIKTGKGCVKVFNSDQYGGPTDQKIIHSCICVPMIIRDKVVGVMYHDNSLLASNFNETDLDILSFFAAQAAIAIDNAQAYGEITRLNRHLKEEKEYYKEKVLEHVHFEEIVGKSQSILEVLSNVKQVADTDATVLILGETGVGKELVARAVHAESARNKGPFIRVHCSALPESLISSELFGHEKGAFTGASQKRIGRFELADNGTLFLDEIGELPMEIQVHLLRVLQTGEFERVGDSKTLKSNFRLVLATNRNLEKEVQKKRFRLDLYYRINVFPILVPPLRDRKEDIPLLASYFSHLYGKRLNKPSCKIRKKDVDKLMAYAWPGNVRELENVIERAMILSKGSELTFPALQCQHPISAAENDNSFPTLVENERQLIIAALRQTSGRIQGKGGAAELLGINHNTLKSRMRKFGIVRDQVMG